MGEMLLTVAKPPSPISRRWPAGLSQFRIGSWWNRHRIIRRRETTEIKRFLDTEINMQDILWILITIAFFALSIGYVYFCDRVK
jgi:hypothetical protein